MYACKTKANQHKKESWVGIMVAFAEWQGQGPAMKRMNSLILNEIWTHKSAVQEVKYTTASLYLCTCM